MQPSSDKSVTSRLKAFADSDRVTKTTNSTNADYPMLRQQLVGLTDGETDRIANLANCSALLWQELSGINWVGF